MKESKCRISDLEREGGDEAHLTNATVRTLTWDIEKVAVGCRLFAESKPEPLIANINGAAQAGTTKLRNACGTFLTAYR
jgi:hypothetical protein